MSKLLLTALAVMISVQALAKDQATKNAPKAVERKVAAEANDGLQWSTTGESCVFYDYRTMIRKGQYTQFFFAIEPQNYNGGSREFTYKQKDFKSVKEAYQKAFTDLNQLMQSGRCDRFSIFYPTLEKPDAPL